MPLVFLPSRNPAMRAPMRWYSKLAAAAAAAILQACATAPVDAPRPAAAAAPVEKRAPVTILVSIDGFRADYLDRGVTPVLSDLAAHGVRAAMRPSFPSKTFPNHYTLVTGLRPDRNGITANKMEDPRRSGEIFTMETDDPFWWNDATPVWVDAEKAGIRTATMFWPGSNVPVGGVKADKWPYKVTGGTRPADWAQFNPAVTGEQRVRGVIDWLRRPAEIRPQFVTLYFDTVDTAGHTYGPDAPETKAAVHEIDGLIGQLMDGLARLHQPANLVIVADHGMAATSSTRVVALNQWLTPDDYHLVETGSYASLAPAPGHESRVEKALLGRHDQFECWRRAEIPARFHYGRNPRVPPIFCLADIGWEIAEKPPERERHGGNHGYDNFAPEMAALFIASGPAFRAGQTLAPFDNVDVEPLLRRLLGLPAGTDRDGDATPFEGVFVR